MSGNDTLARLAAVIESRRGGDPDKSYVARLFFKGTDTILKKVGEEATETVMAGKDGDPKKIVYEGADLWCHSLVALAASAEAFGRGAKGGGDLEVMLEAVNAGSGRNSATLNKFPISVADRSFKYGAEIDIICKDADLAIEQGETLGVPMWVCQAARLAFKHLQFKGCGRDDLTTIVQHIERDAGFQLAKTR